MLGLFGKLFGRSKEFDIIFDADLFNVSERAYMKRLAIDICASFLGRTISLSNFLIKNGDEYVKDELYYRLNVRPNKNMTASRFWQTVVYKLINDNECLIIQADDDDLLIADDFHHEEYAVFEDTFSEVKVKDYVFQRTFRQSEVLYLTYVNEKLTPLINGLYNDYGELFGRILSAQKRKGQIRGTVDVDITTAKNPETLKKLQEFIDNMYRAIREKDVAIVPQQRGFDYKETSNSQTSAFSVDEINKVTGGFLDQVAMAIGIPPSLLYGEMADIEKQTQNYITFTVNPLIKKIEDEANSKFFTKEEFLNGKRLYIQKAPYRDIFDIATAVDKLRASGVMTGNQLREEMGLERDDDPMLDKYFITKNYQESSQALEGGE